MTEKQRKFADEYLIDCNATRAYKAAYPNVKNDSVASVNGSRLLGNASVKNYIEEKMNEVSSEKIASATEVMEYLTSVMRSESKGAEIVVEAIGDGMSEARIMQKPPSEKDKLKAAELLGKRYGIFTEKMTLEVEPVTIVNDLKE